MLVEPLNDGNVGAIARSMKNFGLDEFVLVRPCMIGEEATKRAMHGI
ncbi:MAG TPA: TrmH family RNA methyltransferase, partial [Thermoplasmata archaeon]